MASELIMHHVREDVLDYHFYKGIVQENKLRSVQLPLDLKQFSFQGYDTLKSLTTCGGIG